MAKAKQIELVKITVTAANIAGLFANAEAGQEASEFEVRRVLTAGIDILAGIKTAEEWESFGKQFGLDYNKARNYADTAPAGEKAWGRLVAFVAKEADVRKPQTEKAKAKQAADRVAEVEQLTAALITGIGAERAMNKLEALKKKGGEAAQRAERVEAQCANAIAKRQESEKAKANARKVCEAFALVEGLCGLTKAQQAKWDEAKAFMQQ